MEGGSIAFLLPSSKPIVFTLDGGGGGFGFALGRGNYWALNAAATARGVVATASDKHMASVRDRIDVFYEVF